MSAEAGDYRLYQAGPLTSNARFRIQTQEIIVKLLQENPGCNYRTDDAAQIYFRGSSDAAPTHIRCVGMGYTLSAYSCEEFNVELAPFQLIGVGNFGGLPHFW